MVLYIDHGPGYRVEQERAVAQRARPVLLPAAHQRQHVARAPPVFFIKNSEHADGDRRRATTDPPERVRSIGKKLAARQKRKLAARREVAGQASSDPTPAGPSASDPSAMLMRECLFLKGGPVGSAVRVFGTSAMADARLHSWHAEAHEARSAGHRPLPTAGPLRGRRPCRDVRCCVIGIADGTSSARVWTCRYS